MMNGFSMFWVEPRNGPIRIARKRAEMHEPTAVPAKGGRESVPTRPSGSKSTRMLPAPNGPAVRLHDARPAPTRSTSPCALLRLNGASATALPLLVAVAVAVAVGVTVAVGGGVGTGMGVVVGRVVAVVRTVGIGVLTLPAVAGVPALVIAVAVDGTSTLGGVATVAAGGSGSALDATTATSAMTPPRPRSTTRPIPPRIHGSDEPLPAPGCLLANVLLRPPSLGEGAPSGAPQRKQNGDVFARRSSTRVAHPGQMRAPIGAMLAGDAKRAST